MEGQVLASKKSSNSIMAGNDGDGETCSRPSSKSFISSSYSGTTIYTTSTTVGSHLSSLSKEVAMRFRLLDLYGGGKAERKEKLISKSLIQEFCGGDVIVAVEQWLTELGVGWVLHLPLPDDGASARVQTSDDDVWSWIQALAEIVETISSTELLFPIPDDRGGGGGSMICDEQAADEQFLLRWVRVANKLLRRLTSKLFRINSGNREEEEPDDTGRGPDDLSLGLPTTCEEEEGHVADHLLQFAQFLQETMLKMLPFVDTTVSGVVAGVGSQMQAPYEKLRILLGVHGALSRALPRIQLPSSSAQVLAIQRDIVSLLASKELKAGGAIWSTMEAIRTAILDLMEDDGDHHSSATQAARAGSSDIHKATQAAVSFFRFLRVNYSSLAPIVSVKHVPQILAVPPLDSMIIEMASCLEEKLEKMSESFPDDSLKFLFLLNNSYLISQQVEPIWSAVQSNNVAALNSDRFLSSMKAHTADAIRKVGSYMESYLQASWAPVLSCLFDPTPFCLGKKYSPLVKFDSEFQKVYTTQKLWKVPDPWLRKFLRKSITKKIMSGYTKYIEDIKVTTPRVAPQELEEMLRELFEG